MIAVDWGSSALRLYRMDDGGHIVERRRSDRGASVCRGRFAAVLAEAIAGWNDADILLCGMVGARGGWQEMPYLPCPTGIDALARGMAALATSAEDQSNARAGTTAPDRLPDDAGFAASAAHTTLIGRRILLVPGVSDQHDRVPDVMRGEETQLAALLQTLPPGRHVVCLPGTHCKWVIVSDGCVQRVTTAMTGEVYALLRSHGSLAALMAAEDTGFDGHAFDAGLSRSAEHGGLLHHLFGVRTMGLLGGLSAAELPSYLSGLLIGHELRACSALALDAPTPVPRPAQVHLIGSDRLRASYARALTTLGLGVQRHAEDLAAHGLHALWRRRRELDAAA